MKLKYLLLIGIIFTFTFCSNDPEEDPNELGGDTNVAMGTVGNEFSASVKIGSNNIDLKEELKISKSEDGIVSIDAKADLSNVPELSELNDLIPSSMKDENGKIKTTIKYKITSEGIQDYYNDSKKPFTIGKYDCNVGDVYKFTTSDGKKVTRKVVSKSSTDDFSYGFYNIKAISVEQNSNIPGVEKIEYKLNHKFGLVYMAIVLEDGTKIDSRIYSLN